MPWLSALPRRYHLLRALGRGGQGSVYLVRDVLLDGALLALKLVLDRRQPTGEAGRPAAGTETLAEEFLVLSRLAHPSLARVRDFGRLGGEEGVFFTCDHCPGVDLLQWSLAHPFSGNWNQLYSIAAQVLGALHTIHSAGYVHGDVKPAHILVEESTGGARVTLIDFGSARLSAALSSERRATPAYLAPEALGAGPPADLYALGMSLFHAIAGRLPFALGDPRALEAWRRSGRPARPLDWLEDAPRAASELVERLTAASSAERFRSAREALEYLESRTAAGRPSLLSRSSRAPLLGRDEPLGKLLSALPSPAAPLAVVAAPPGLGKTRLLEEALRRAQVSGFETVLATAADSARALAQLGDLLPGCPPGSRSPDTTPEDLGAALLERASGARVLVALDGILDGEEDAADPFAARAWAAFARGYLARPPGSLRLIVSSRTPHRLRELPGADRVRLLEVRLEPLSRAALREMAVHFFRTTAVSEPVIDRLEAASGGAPGRAWEALLSMARGGARTDPLGLLVVPEVLEGPVEGGTGPGRIRDPIHLRALAVAALLPEPVDAHAVGRYAPLLGPAGEKPIEEESWERVLDDLVCEGCLARRGDRYRLRDPGSASLWLEAIEPAVLDRAQRAVFRDLREAAPLPAARDPDRLSALTRAASRENDRRLAGRALLLSLRRLRAHKRFADALSLLREVLPVLEGGKLEPRAARLLVLRQAELTLLDGRPAERESAAKRIEAAFLPHGSGGMRPQAFLLWAELENRSGHLAAAEAKLKKALELFETNGSRGMLPARWYEVSARLASILFTQGLPAGGAALLERGRELLARLRGSTPSDGACLSDDLPGCARALSRFATLWNRHGEPTTAAALFEASLELARRTGRQDLEPGPLHELALLHAARSRYCEAEQAFLACERTARETGDRSALLRVRINLATLYHKRGDLEQAERLFLEARALADELGQDGPAAAAWIGLEVIRRERGDLREALRLGRGILRRFPRSQRTLHANAHFNLGEIYLALGRPEVARRHRARALAMARSHDYRFLVSHGLVGLASVRLAVGDLAGAECRLRSARRAAGEGADHQLSGALAFYEGLGALAREDLKSALRSLGRAMFHARRAVSSARLDGALLALVDLHLRRGDLDRAQAILSRREARAPSGDGASVAGGQHRFLAEALHLRARRDWPQSCGALLEIARRAEAAGELHAALRIVSDALKDRALGGSPPPELILLWEALLARFLRRSPPRDWSSFRRTYGGLAVEAQAEDAVREGKEASLKGPGARDPLVELAARWAAFEVGAGPREQAGIEAELGRLKEAIPVRALWVLNEPGIREPMFYAAGAAGPPADLFSGRARLIEEVRGRGGTVWGDGFGAVVLPGGSVRGRREARRVLYLELSGPPQARLRERIELAAALLSSFLRLKAAESVRKADRERLRERLREIHRLNVILSQGKGQVETAILTQRLLMVEKSRAQEARRLAGGIRMQPVAVAPVMRALVERLRKVAQEDIPVLLLGEHGVGKDLLARALHGESRRRGGPFVSEVCTIAESLLESELFGYVRGAFTDAVEDRPGLLQLTSGGTLYLDEISEMSAALQARLMRVLEEGRARPIGAEEPVPIDLRLVSSSRRTLRDLESSGVLRPDFLYRIRGEVLEVPPLRERREDIPVLVRLFAEECARASGLEPPPIEPDLLSDLAGRDWPGNVRQLENEVRRAFLLSPGRLTREAFPDSAADAQGPPRGEPLPWTARAQGASVPFRAARRKFERELLQSTLAAHGGNASRAAKALRITRRYLGILLGKHGLRLKDFQRRDAPA